MARSPIACRTRRALAIQLSSVGHARARGPSRHRAPRGPSNLRHNNTVLAELQSTRRHSIHFLSWLPYMSIINHAKALQCPDINEIRRNKSSRLPGMSWQHGSGYTIPGCNHGFPLGSSTCGISKKCSERLNLCNICNITPLLFCKQRLCCSGIQLCT